MTEFRRSSFCSGGACVEVALLGDLVLVRGGTFDAATLTFRRDEWADFLRGACAGEFDLPESSNG